jgi:uncharacterized protein (TIGR03435 family)
MLLEHGREFSPRVSRARVAVSAAMLLGCVMAGAIAPRLIALAQAPVRFEVASVKPMEHDNGRRLTCDAGRRFQATNTLFWLIYFGYQVSDAQAQILGGPVWIDSPDATFDIEAKPAAPPVSSEDCRRMVQTLLADRFKLVLHKEKREMPVYALVVGSKGSKLHDATGEEPLWPGSRIMINGASLQVNDNYSRSTARGMTMGQLAGHLQQEPGVGRLVVDETNLKGTYPLTLDYSNGSGNDDRPDLFTALQEQLGLKLESKKEPVEVLVIDHAAKPDAN